MYQKQLINRNLFTNSFKQPQVETNFKETNIKIWKVDLVSTYPNLSKEAKLIFTYIDKNGKNKYTAKELKEELKLSKYVFQRAIKELSNTDLIVITGNGRGRAYSKSLTKLELYVGVQKLADRLRMGN
jgi:ATP-dependent DNA helicase RecG